MASSTMERRWIDVHSQKPRAVARQAIRQLAMAEQEGLVAQDYQVQALEEALVAAIQKNLSAEEGVQLKAASTKPCCVTSMTCTAGVSTPKP